MHILNDSHVANIHAKGVTQPAKLLADVVGPLAYFVQKDTCLNLEQVSVILFQVLSTYHGVHFLDPLLNKSSHSISHHVHHGYFLFAVTPKLHGVGLIQSPCS